MRGNQRQILRAGLIVLVGAGAVSEWLLAENNLDPARVEAALNDAGGLAPLVFIGAFAVATVLFLPGSLFGLAVEQEIFGTP